MKTFFAAAALAGLAAADASNHWAVLVAGSNGYWNYRHQADTAHAYQIMKENGIPADHIIHMAYDDIADNAENPFPGLLFNYPDGHDVYQGATIDYSGKDVTPENFIEILTGGKPEGGNGKVLKSDSSSKVFVYFADHGAPGLIAFPTSYLYADALNDAINTMHANNMYDQLVFYIEACESGSMFPNLKSDINVAAMTASNATLSSWAAYCSPDDEVNGVPIGSCLGDLFSVNWMEDTEMNNPKTESMLMQHNNVKVLTTASPVEIFGDVDLVKYEVVGMFQGISDTSFVSWQDKVMDMVPKMPKAKKEKKSIVDSRDVKLHYLSKRAERNGGPKAHQELKDEIDHRMYVDSLFAKTFPDHQNNELVTDITDYDCLRFLIDSTEQSCGRFTDYSLKYVKNLAHICETSSPLEVNYAAVEITKYCSSE